MISALPARPLLAPRFSGPQNPSETVFSTATINPKDHYLEFDVKDIAGIRFKNGEKTLAEMGAVCEEGDITGSQLSLYNGKGTVLCKQDATTSIGSMAINHQNGNNGIILSTRNPSHPNSVTGISVVGEQGQSAYLQASEQGKNIYFLINNANKQRVIELGCVSENNGNNRNSGFLNINNAQGNPLIELGSAEINYPSTRPDGMISLFNPYSKEGYCLSPGYMSDSNPYGFLSLQKSKS